MSKVMVQLTNGFGNNIFQYVAARILAEHHKKEVFAIPFAKNYYAIPCLEKKGIKFADFTGQTSNNVLLYISELNYLESFNGEYPNSDFVLSGYFEDYRYFIDHRDKIKSWFPKVKVREERDLVLHFRTGDRLFMKNEFYTKPSVEKYINAINKFNFERLHIVTDMPKWDYVTENELKNMKFHNIIPEDEKVPIQHSVQYFNSFVDALKPFDPIVENRSVGEDFDFIRSFRNILFEHGTLSWWAAFLSEAQKVGVYGPWRAFKGNKNKNLSQIPLAGWFKWE
jgi:hypothetical protein